MAAAGRWWVFACDLIAARAESSCEIAGRTDHEAVTPESRAV
jgi:hypothetical protein